MARYRSQSTSKNHREGTLVKNPKLIMAVGGSTVTMAVSTMMAALVLDASAPDRYMTWW